MSTPNPAGLPAMAPGGGMRQPGAPWMARQYYARTFFTYEADIPAASLPFNAGGAVTVTFNIAGDSDFFWTKFATNVLVGGAATTRLNDQLPAVTILITNTTTGRQYSSNPVPLATVSGTGELPFIVPMITLWEKKSTIQLTLSNEGNANYSVFHMSFHGIKAFY